MDSLFLSMPKPLRLDGMYIKLIRSMYFIIYQFPSDVKYTSVVLDRFPLNSTYFATICNRFVVVFPPVEW